MCPNLVHCSYFLFHAIYCKEHHVFQKIIASEMELSCKPLILFVFCKMRHNTLDVML